MSFLSHHTRNDHQGMRGLLPSMLSFVLAGVLAAGCNQPKEHFVYNRNRRILLILF